MPSKSFNVKVAVAVTAAVLSVAGVAAAAATNRSTGSAEKAAARAALAHRGATPPGAEGSGANGNGPDVTGPARDGLCRAWQSGQGGSNGGKQDSVAFRALAAAAGGADKVAAFCRTTNAEPATNGQGQGSQPSDTRPPSGDHGNGQGGPPTTSG